MHAEYVLSVVADEELGEELQMIRCNFRLPTVIFQVTVPELNRQIQLRAKL